MKDMQTKERFIVLRAQGLSYDKIAGELGVSKPTLLKWNAELAGQLSEARIMELDAVLEEFGITKIARVRNIARMLNRVEEELARRDFSAVPTIRLIEAASQLRSELVEEVSSVSQQFRFGGIPELDNNALFEGVVVRRTALD